MRDFLIVKNSSREGPGLLEGVLERAGVRADVVDLDAGDVFPDPTLYKALVVLGGPDSANDATAKMRAELTQIRRALDHAIPYLGICLGLQTLVKAAGGQVVAAETKEIGLLDPEGRPFRVALTEDGRKDPLFEGLPDSLPVFQLHGETVVATEGMTLLATGSFCKAQIVRVAPRAYGIQSHLELTAALLDVWATEDPDLRPLGVETLRASFRRIQPAYATTGETLLCNFLRIAGFDL